MAAGVVTGTRRWGGRRWLGISAHCVPKGLVWKRRCQRRDRLQVKARPLLRPNLVQPGIWWRLGEVVCHCEYRALQNSLCFSFLFVFLQVIFKKEKSLWRFLLLLLLSFFLAPEPVLSWSLLSSLFSFQSFCPSCPSSSSSSSSSSSFFSFFPPSPRPPF